MPTSNYYQSKIDTELAKNNPDWDMISHWEVKRNALIELEVSKIS